MYILPAHISHGTPNVPALNLPDSLCHMADEHNKAQAIVSCHAAESRHISTNGFSAEFFPDSEPTADCMPEYVRLNISTWRKTVGDLYINRNFAARQIYYKQKSFY